MKTLVQKIRSQEIDVREVLKRKFKKDEDWDQETYQEDVREPTGLEVPPPIASIFQSLFCVQEERINFMKLTGTKKIF